MTIHPRALIDARKHHVPHTNSIELARLTTGQRVADSVAHVMGSWKFIIAQSIVLCGWIVLNVVGWINGWDPYPFILLNLALSFQAAFSAPIIMMSQNRQSAKDRLSSDHDFEVNVRTELEATEIRARLYDLMSPQWNALVDLQNQQLALLRNIHNLTAELKQLNNHNRPDAT